MLSSFLTAVLSALWLDAKLNRPEPVGCSPSLQSALVSQFRSTISEIVLACAILVMQSQTFNLMPWGLVHIATIWPKTTHFDGVWCKSTNLSLSQLGVYLNFYYTITLLEKAEAWMCKERREYIVYLLLSALNSNLFYIWCYTNLEVRYLPASSKASVSYYVTVQYFKTQSFVSAFLLLTSRAVFVLSSIRHERYKIII